MTSQPPGETVPVFDYLRGLHADYRDQVYAAVRRVIESGQLILGPEVKALEQEFATYVGTRFSVGVSSGTDALILALRALEIGPGDEVVTVSHTAVPTVSAIRAVGAVPVFVDVDADSLLMDASRIESVLSQRTRCLLPVHLYGHPVNLDALLEIARRHDIPVVEDCAQAHAARWKGQHVGGFGSIGCFSFYPTKNLGALGDAGACVTDDPKLAERLTSLRMYGFGNERISFAESGNHRMDEIQAAILREKLKLLDNHIHARRGAAAYYAEQLATSDCRLPTEAGHAFHAYHLYVIRCPNRPLLIRTLKQAKIQFGVHYPTPVHQMPAYTRFAPPAGALPVTEQAAQSVLSLPLFPELTILEQDRVCRAVMESMS